MGNHTSRSQKFLTSAYEAKFSELEKLFEADGVEHGRRKNVFDSIKQIICKLPKCLSYVGKCIIENWKYIKKDTDMKGLVRQCIDDCLETKQFYYLLRESLMREVLNHSSKVDVQLQSIAPERSPISEAQRQKVKENLKEFVNDEDVFKDFLQRYVPLLQRHEETRKKLEEKIKRLRRKSKAKKVGLFILGTVTAAMAVCCGVLVAIAPWGPGLGAAVGLYSASMGSLTEEMVSFLKNKNKNTTMELMVNKMEEKTSVTVNKLKTFRCSVVGDLSSVRRLIVFNIENYLKNDDEYVCADIAKRIKKLQQPLMQKIEDLCKDVDRCIAEIDKHVEELKFA